MTARDCDFLFYLEDMLESMHRIKKYTAGLSYEEFKESDLRIDASFGSDQQLEPLVHFYAYDSRTR